MYIAISAAFLWPSRDDEVDWVAANQISHNSIQMYGGQLVSCIFREIHYSKYTMHNPIIFGIELL